ncbi:MAG: hypothetical protein WC755_06585 [Candidatus Woesearchaeota archaeon]|jgi:hypothetical protein
MVNDILRLEDIFTDSDFMNSESHDKKFYQIIDSLEKMIPITKYFPVQYDAITGKFTFDNPEILKMNINLLLKVYLEKTQTTKPEYSHTS